MPLLCLLAFMFYSRLNFTLTFSHLNAELNPICHLLALVGARHIVHVSKVRVKYLSTISLEMKKLLVFELFSSFLNTYLLIYSKQQSPF